MKRRPLTFAELKAAQAELAKRTGGTPFHPDEATFMFEGWEESQFADILGAGCHYFVLALQGDEFVVVRRPDGPYPYASMCWEVHRAGRFSEALRWVADRTAREEES